MNEIDIKNTIKKDINEISKKLYEITNKWKSILGNFKVIEPRVKIALNKDGDYFFWSASAECFNGVEIYLARDDYHELIELLWEDIGIEEQRLKEFENEVNKGDDKNEY